MQEVDFCKFRSGIHLNEFEGLGRHRGREGKMESAKNVSHVL